MVKNVSHSNTFYSYEWHQYRRCQIRKSIDAWIGIGNPAKKGFITLNLFIQILFPFVMCIIPKKKQYQMWNTHINSKSRSYVVYTNLAHVCKNDPTQKIKFDGNFYLERFSRFQFQVLTCSGHLILFSRHTYIHCIQNVNTFN